MAHCFHGLNWIVEMSLTSMVFGMMESILYFKLFM